MRSASRGFLLVCAGLVASAFSAKAQELPQIELEWTAPHECPDRDAVLHIIRSRSSERPAVVPLRARAKIVRRGTGYRLDLALDQPEGSAQRTLMNPRCGRLAEAAAVLIVLAMESEGKRAAESPAPTPALEPPAVADGAGSSPSGARAPSSALTPATPAPSEAPQTTPSESEDSSLNITHDDPAEASTQRALHLQLSAAARADLGTFPHQPALGVQAQLAGRIKPLFVALGATYWAAREQLSVSYPSARLRGSGVFGELGVGLDISAKPVVLTPALNIELGLLHAEAVGIAGPERERVLWFAFGPSLSAAVNILKDFSLALDVAGLIPAYQTHWLVRTPQGDVPAFDAAPLVLRIAVRVGYSVL